MLFKTTAIIGLGVIGGSLAGALRKYAVTERIIGITRSDAHVRAKKSGLIGEGYPIDKLETGVKDADLIILATPIRKICALIPAIIPLVKPGCVITDVGSTKHVISEIANTFGNKNVHFIGGHPMAGSEKTGFEAGDADLFRNRPYAIVQGDETPERIVEKMCDLVSKIGAIPIQLDAITHDRIVAGISHLSQLTAIAIMNVLGKENDQDDRYFQMSGPAFGEMTRIAGSAYSIWEDILISNRRNISNVLQNFIEELEQIQISLNKASLKKEFDMANSFRKQLASGGRAN